MNLYKKNLGILSEQLDGKMHWDFGGLEKKVFELSDQQLDSKMHWMFMNEPHFQMYFVESVLYHLHNDYGTNDYTDENIFASIGKAAHIIDYDLSADISPMDKAMIQVTFNTFVSNGFKNAENHPWIIQPSENPDYEYDWILWNDDYPIVQYNSKRKQIDPCLDFGRGLDSFNLVVNAIHEASRDSAVPDVMCASEYKPKETKDLFYEAEDMLQRHGIDVSNVQGNGNLMSVHLLAHELNNEVFKHLSKRIDFKRGDGKDLIIEAEDAGFLMDADSFCREQIRKDNSLLEYPLEQLLHEAKEILNVFKNGVAAAKDDFIHAMPLEVSLDGFRTALDRYANGKPAKCGPWDIEKGFYNLSLQISYKGKAVVCCYGNGKDYGLGDKIGVLQRETSISDNSFSKICDMVHSVFPNYVMAPFEQEKINANKQSQGIK